MQAQSVNEEPAEKAPKLDAVSSEKLSSSNPHKTKKPPLDLKKAIEPHADENQTTIENIASKKTDNCELKKVKRKSSRANRASSAKTTNEEGSKRLEESLVDAQTDSQCQLTSETVMSYEIQGAEDSGVDEVKHSQQRQPKSKTPKHSRLKKNRRTTETVEVSVIGVRIESTPLQS